MSTRKANGESSIHKGADGRWHGYVSMGQKDHGKPDRRHVSGVKRADVVDKVRELERKRDAGVVTKAGTPPTVRAWLSFWLDTIAAPRLRPTTLKHYRTSVDLHLVPKVGHHRLDKLQPEHLEAAYASLAAEGLGPASILYAHRVLSRALKVALQRGRVARNVATLVEAPRVPHHEVQPLTTAEAQAVLRAAVGEWNAARWSVALALGLRQGEALGLQWGDVDLIARRLTIRRQLQRVTGQGLVFSEPKSKAGRRTLALPTALAAELQAHRAQQIEHRLAAGSEWEDHDLVFCQTNGRPIDPAGDLKAWKRLLVAADVRCEVDANGRKRATARLHDARHTAASLLLAQGVHPRTAMAILGHSQISVTMNLYSHVMPEVAEDAAERVGAALFAPTATTTAPSALREA